MRPDRTKACARKKGYATSRHANQVKHLRERDGVMNLRVYQCDVCGRWHLTKKPG